MSNLVRRDLDPEQLQDHYYQVQTDFQLRDEPSPSTRLREYWCVVWKRKWIVVAVLFTIVTATAIEAFRQVPIYTATAKLSIDAESVDVLPYKDIYQDGPTYRFQDYLQTQIKIIQSRSLATRVVQAEGLDRKPTVARKPEPKPPPTFFQSLRGSIRGLFRNEIPKVAPSPEALENLRRKGLIDAVLGGLSVVPVRNSSIVEISYTSPDPQLAARLANIVANEYIEQNFEAKYSATSRATEFLQKQLIDLKAKIEKSEEALLQYAHANDILYLGEKQEVPLQTIADLNAELMRARMDRISKESFYKTLADATPENFPQALRTGYVQELEQSIAGMKRELARLKTQFGPEWPEVKKLQNQVQEAQSQLLLEKQRAINHARTEYQAAFRREELLIAALSDQKVLTNQITQADIHYNILKREVDTNKQLYNGLLQRMKEAGVAASLKSSNIRIVDPAEVPSFPSSPQRNQKLRFGLLLGLVAGLGLAFLLEYLDNTLKTPEDVERYAGLVSLGLIPSLKSASRKSAYFFPYPHSRRKRLPGQVEHRIALAPHTESKSVIAEAYRSVRTSILLSSPNSPPRAILVTSAKAGEGKTTTTCNTAVSLAQTGARVLVVDCDMRRPCINKIFGLNGNAGLTEYLTGQADFAQVLQKTTIPNLDVICCGAIPPNPAELLGSRRMQEGVKLLATNFDHVLFDTPPVLSVTDALVMAPFVDGVILVIEGGKTPREVVKKARKHLESVNARILGVLINNVDVRSPDYSYYYRDYYDYGSYVNEKGEGI